MADACLALLWTSLTAYALLGGADFGGGIVELTTRGPRAGRLRSAIQTSMGPVWEANHVWLIFFITGLFTVFPRAFEALSLALYLPLLLALVGIVLRGAAFAFRGHYGGEGAPRQIFGRVFAVSSTITPFLFGAAAGGLAGRTIQVHDGKLVSPGVIGVWTAPFAIVCGLLALSVCAYLAATYLTVEMSSRGEHELLEDFRRRALGLGALTGALSVLGIVLAKLEADRLYAGLVGDQLPLVIVAVLAGSASVAAIRGRLFRLARAALALAVASVIWGWGLSQYPQLVGPGVTAADSVAVHATQVAFLVGAGVGMAVLLPALILLLVMFRRDPEPLER